MKKILATLLILCSVVAATSFGSEAKLEPSYQWLSLTSSRVELKASYPDKCNQMVLSLNMVCRNGKAFAQNSVDNTFSVNTAYSANSNISKGLINLKFGVDHTLRITNNGKTVIM